MIEVACHWSNWHGKGSDWTEIKERETWTIEHPKLVSMTIGGCWDGKWNFMLLYAQIWKYWNANVKAEARGEMKSPYKEILVARRSKTDRVEIKAEKRDRKTAKNRTKTVMFWGKNVQMSSETRRIDFKGWGSDFSSHPPRDLPRRGNHQKWTKS